MRLTALPLLVALALSVIGSPSAARASGFHVEASGVLLNLDAPLPQSAEGFAGSGVPDASALFGLGPGFQVGAAIDLGPHWSLGARSGLFRNLERPTATLRFGRRDSLGTTGEFRNHLTMIPTHAVLQYRRGLDERSIAFAELGVGVITFTEKISFTAPGQLPRLAAGYQTSFSYLAGVGFERVLVRDLAIALRADFYQSVPDPGAVWNRGDDPTLVVGALGLRYPR